MALSRFVLCLLVLGLTGCMDEDPGDPPTICAAPPSINPGSVPRQGLLKVGQKFTLSVSPLPAQDCGQGPSHPTSVTAEIEGPDGKLLENQTELGPPGSPATVQFTPVRPGPHHILVAFSQVGGIHQFDFHALVDSSAAAPSHTLQQPCASLERTQQGTWVCDFAVLRGETVVHSFPNARLAVAGDVLWVVTSGSVQRYVDTGAELVLTGSLRHSQGEATFLLASVDELAVAHDYTLALYSFSGGTLGTAGADPWPRPAVPVGSSGPFGVLLREGPQFALVIRESLEFNPVFRVCPYQLVSGRIQRTSGGCTVMQGETVGFEPTILWTRTPPFMVGNGIEQGTLHRWQWTGGRLVEQGSVSLGGHARITFPPMMSPSTVPIIYSDASRAFPTATAGVAIWSAERRLIFFEYLDSEVQQPRASTDLYWGSVTPSTTRIRIRPPAPVP
jgi:hypothetical protein